jgi:3-methyl-2-oxobutanoate hydroxymethyltransferase
MTKTAKGAVPKAHTIKTLQQMKENGEKITMLTCYDSTFAKLLYNAGVDTILVGDSLGNTMLGYSNTIPVTVEDIIHHTAAVKRAVPDAFVIGDMPFMSYQVTPASAVKNAALIMQKGGANAIKLEGVSSEILIAVAAISNAGIPVVGHLGLTPQYVHAMGGYKTQGKALEDALKIATNAVQLENAGASMIVLEGIPADLAKYITASLDIPVIGIGAGNDCDGQVLVLQDMLGMNGTEVPKFVKLFADLQGVVTKAVQDYSSEVKSGSFPAAAHSTEMSKSDYQRLTAIDLKQSMEDFMQDYVDDDEFDDDDDECVCGNCG